MPLFNAKPHHRIFVLPQFRQYLLIKAIYLIIYFIIYLINGLLRKIKWIRFVKGPNGNILGNPKTFIP